MTQFDAPIALFVYNRPEHARRTLESLRRNRGARESKLFIFSDGPREDATGADAQRVGEVRQVIRERPWCGRVEIVETDSNRGLAASIRGGIDRVLNTSDRIIVLEDDLELSPGFLPFMNRTLEVYEREPRVMAVSGYLPQSSYRWILPETFFLRHMSCWGWATWRESWRRVAWDARDLLTRLRSHPGGTHGFDLEGAYPFSDQLRRNLDGSLSTWAIFWLTSIYLADGLVLFPRRSLVDNFGFDGSGEHCAVDHAYAETGGLAVSVSVTRKPLWESRRGRWYLKSFHRYGGQGELWSRARRALGNAKHSTVGNVRRTRKKGAERGNSSSERDLDGLSFSRRDLIRLAKRLPGASKLARIRRARVARRIAKRDALGKDLFSRWQEKLTRYSPPGESNVPGSRVVHVTRNLYRGGAARVARQIHTAVSGHYESHLYFGNREDVPDEPDVDLIPSDALSDEMISFGWDHSLRGFTNTSTDRFVKSLARAGVHLVHLHNLHPDYFNLFSLPELSNSIPTVWTLHDEFAFTGHCACTLDCDGWTATCEPCPYLDRYLELRDDRAGEHLRLKSAIYSKSPFVAVCVSDWLARRARRSILRDHDIRVIHNGVDTSLFRPAEKGGARDRLGLPRDEFLCGFAADGGIQNPWKGGTTLGSLVESLAWDDLSLVCVGGSERQDAAGVIDLGYLDEPRSMADVYNAVDLWIHPTEADSFGLVVAEAMACGTPLIASSVGAIPELIVDGTSGVLVEPGEVRELHLAIETLRRDGARRRSIGEAACQRIRRSYSEQRMVEDYLKLYEETMSSGRSAPR